MGIGFISLGL